MEFGLIIALLMAWWGWSIAEDKGFEPIVGALVGFLFNLIGILVLYLWPARQY
ncbi:MAG TPA: hypothetical protein VEI97_01195 [bacterium]|nr:hypothetical protein [bacterium]